jgi:chromate reductase, NAD(P)H dehydrogenase (quinone)
MDKKTIIAFSGSTRTNATNEQVLKHIAAVYEARLEMQYFDLTTLPFFNPDTAEEARPASVRDFCHQLTQADGVLICTPEDVFSLPGVLKNALEWTVATTVFSDKPTALITAAALGEKAHASLVLIMNTLQARIGRDATLLISGARSKVNQQGAIADKDTLAAIEKLMTSFLETMDAPDTVPHVVSA